MLQTCENDISTIPEYYSRVTPLVFSGHYEVYIIKIFIMKILIKYYQIYHNYDCEDNFCAHDAISVILI